MLRSCTRKYQMGSVLFCTSDQHSGPDISLLQPHLQGEWDHAGNAHLVNIQITPHNAKSVCWVCDECPLGCPHKWTARVYSRTNGNQCPFCASKRPCQHNSLATQAPAIAAEFSNKNMGTPHDWTVSSGKTLLWRCMYGHEWLATVNKRTSGKTGCPSCYDQQQRGRSQMQHPVLTDSQHPMMQQWDWPVNANAGLNPSQITCSSHKKAHWICLRCSRGPHRWQAAVYHIFDGSRCPCCSGCKPCICNSLQSLAPEVAAEWDYVKNKGTPSDYTAFSHAKVWWHNEVRGSFQAAVVDRTYVRKPQPGS